MDDVVIRTEQLTKLYPGDILAVDHLDLEVRSGEIFGLLTREIEDRVLAPMPVTLVALEKVTAGALYGAVSAALVFPIATIVPATPWMVRACPTFPAPVPVSPSPTCSP